MLKNPFLELFKLLHEIFFVYFYFFSFLFCAALWKEENLLVEHLANVIQRIFHNIALSSLIFFVWIHWNFGVFVDLLDEEKRWQIIDEIELVRKAS